MRGQRTVPNFCKKYRVLYTIDILLLVTNDYYYYSNCLFAFTVMVHYGIFYNTLGTIMRDAFSHCLGYGSRQLRVRCRAAVLID
jgi:hypothetical protein